MDTNNNYLQGQKQKQQQQEQKEQAQKEDRAKEKAFKNWSASQVTFQFSDKKDKPEGKMTQISPELDAAFRKKRSKEFMDIIKKQEISGMSDEEIKRIIAREIVKGGADSIEDVVKLSTFMSMEEEETEEASAEEKALMSEMSEDDVVDFLEMLNASIAEDIAKEEMLLKESLVELDKKAIDESYVLGRCPIRPAHDIHILPKNGRLYFCHLVKGKLSPVFEEAKKLIESGKATCVHVYQGCAFVINEKGEVTRRIDVVEEPMELIIKNGWEELP